MSNIPVSLQFCLGEADITGSPYASLDADQVRLWHEDTTNIATVIKHDNAWYVSNSDEVHWQEFTCAYRTWQDAMERITRETIYVIPSH